jgi:hypothetical protein
MKGRRPRMPLPRPRQPKLDANGSTSDATARVGRHTHLASMVRATLLLEVTWHTDRMVRATTLLEGR